MMRIEMQRSLRQEQECSVCRNFISHRGDDITMVALLGAVAFAQCPCCSQEVLEHKDKNYRARARRWIRKHKTN